MNQSNRVIITGGGSGLGRALALRWSKAGARVCITDKNESDVQAVAQQLEQHGEEVLALRADVTSEADWEKVVTAVTEHWGGVDILINNAGVATAGALETESIQQWQWILDINLLGIVRGCQAFLPLLRQSEQAQIINIASQAGINHLADMGSYNASKAAVVAYSETLRAELAGDGILVSVVCPSFFKTNLNKAMRTEQPHLRKRVDKLFERATMSADDVADYVYRKSQTQAFMILPHKLGRRAWLMKRFLPNLSYIRMMTRHTRR